MTAALSTAVIAIVGALGIAAVAGIAHNRRSGVLREVRRSGDVDTSRLGLSVTGPTIVHFTAEWCGPCAAVRRVVERVCAELPEVAHVEIDMDADPGAARALSVLSLPTTFVFDAQGQQRYRTSGVPTAAGLQEVLTPLLA